MRFLSLLIIGTSLLVGCASNESGVAENANTNAAPAAPSVTNTGAANTPGAEIPAVSNPEQTAPAASVKANEVGPQ